MCGLYATWATLSSLIYDKAPISSILKLLIGDTLYLKEYEVIGMGHAIGNILTHIHLHIFTSGRQFTKDFPCQGETVQNRKQGAMQLT